MMFSILNLHLRNFKSYVGEHKIDLPTAPGLYFIAGRSDLGGNGAGKSTILDAIVWCLFGSTSKGEKASDIVTRGQKTAHVQLTLTVADQQLEVLRQQSPNALIMNGRHVSQDEIEKAVRLNKSSFLYSVIAPQGGQSFFRRSPAEKLTLFSQIMGLEFWIEKSLLAAEEVRKLDGDIAKVQTALTANRIFLKTADQEIASLEAKAASFKDESRKTVLLLEDQANTARTLIDKKSERVNRLDELISFNLDELKKWQDKLNRQQKAKEGHLERQSEFKSRWAVAESALKAKRMAAGRFDGLGATCPTCNQTITSGHLKAEKRHAENEVRQLEAALAMAEQEYKNTRTFTDKIGADIASTAGVITAIEADLKKWEVRADGLELEMKHHREEIIRAENEIIAEKARVNPYVEIRKQKTESMAAAKAKIAKAEDELQDLTTTHTAVSYWVQGFKKVRLYLIDETLRALEIEVNNCLTSLGLVGWSVEFDIERENKSGGVTKGFTVFVREPNYPDPIKFESWSGGEAQRLQLAGDLGLSNLIMTQAGLTNTIEVYDEPSNYLSPAGLADLAETLQQRAVNEGKCIILIDHHTIEFGEFAGTYTVTKDEKGSRFDAG